MFEGKSKNCDYLSESHMDYWNIEYIKTNYLI